tara:strand:+ start:196 stop:297 length:102 start_codon:yes stop_codon:yes gene_type:complete
LDLADVPQGPGFPVQAGKVIHKKRKERVEMGYI